MKRTLATFFTLMILAAMGLAACSTPTPPPPTPTPLPPTATPAEESVATPTEAAGLIPPEDPTTVEMPADPKARDRMFAAPPPMIINPDKFYVATIVLEKGGEMSFRLFPQEAPQTVNNFVYLAEAGFYDGTSFFRVIPGFVAQGGDPLDDGTGDPGYTFPDEFSPDLAHDRVGVLSMANTGPDTNGCQFFITFEPTPWLDDHHTVFGRLIDGLETLRSITPRDPETATERGDVIETIRITEMDEPPVSKLPADEEIAVPEEPEARANLYPQPPAMTIDPTAHYTATLVTPKGEIVLTLRSDAAPQTVNNFVFLARAGFYDGLTFHRVEPDFVIQGGDPLGSGQGGPGYVIPPEIGLPHTAGALAMARLSDRGNPRRMSSGSQFYITLTQTEFLDGAYTVFGYVAEGMDVVQAIEVGDPIEQVIIEEEK